MLNKVRQLAMIKFAGDKSAADEFVNGFVKEAMSGVNPANDSFKAEEHKLKLKEHDLNVRKFDLDHSMKTGVGPTQTGFFNEVGKGMGNLVLTMGIAGAGKIYTKIRSDQLHTRFLSALEKAISSNHLIGEADRGKVMQYATTIFKFAPNIATDVNVLTSVLSNAIHGEGIDPATIKALTDIEGRFAENDSFSPKTYI